MALTESPKLEKGFKAPSFRLKNVNGGMLSLDDIKGENGVVVCFICNHCPYVQAIIERLVVDTSELTRLGVGIVGIMSNDYVTYPEDDFQNMIRFSKDNGLNFPYLIDETQDIAKNYGALCTPDFFGFNKNLELHYRGRIDEFMTNPRKEGAPSELVDAMELIISTGEGPLNQFPSMGCSIKWK